MRKSRLGDIVPSTPADELAALKAQAQLLELRNRLQAAQLEQTRLAGIQDAADAQNANAAPTASSIVRKVIKLEAPRWHQDILQRPATSASGRLNDVLEATDKMHAAYAFNFTATALAAQFRQTFAIELNRAFWIANVTMQKFVTATQAISTSCVGFLTIRDNANGNNFVSACPSPCFGGANAVAGRAARSIWPLPYGIGAGGSFEVIIDYPATAGIAAGDTQVIIEGWWDFSHMERPHG